jgi:hypothetical protein
MAEKSKGPKKKPVKRGVRATNNAKQAAPKAVFYVSNPPAMVTITNQKPSDATPAKQFTAFDAAKSAAIDALIAAIENAEQELLALKRAASYDQLPKARG